MRLTVPVSYFYNPASFNVEIGRYWVNQAGG